MVVLLEADSIREAVTAVGSMDLADLAHEIDGGEWIGHTRITASETVAPEAVQTELLAIGNDGSFFEILD